MTRPIFVAALLATAAVGVACGLHLYVMASAATALFLLTLGPLSRMSRPITHELPGPSPIASANAAPTARAPSASHSAVAPPSTPRMSFALKIPSCSTRED